MACDERQRPPGDGVTSSGKGPQGGAANEPARRSVIPIREALATVQEVAAFLKVPPRTLYRWRYRGEGPPGFRVGRHLRFRWEEVEKWLAAEIRRTRK